MSDSDPSLRSIFCEAVERPAPEERAAYLDSACGRDAELRARVEALLAAHDAAGEFLGRRNEPPPAFAPTLTERPLTEAPGTVVGPYKLLEQIGEGGFGVVFMAEQTAPVKRKVALKVIKPGMDTRQVIARFEAERQALALMDHPNIARILDAGTTNVVRSLRDRDHVESSLPEQGAGSRSDPPTLADPGRPYFVMELVKGIPITEYCDQDRLTIRDRLTLFLDVCHAVQHAHQKGVIHRDLKPSNLLVTVQDGRPLVKVIDFGIAKAMGQQLTDRTLFTGFAQLIGTPLYMSPEQAALSAVDVDTRSDVYSLGVLLYELLTGTTPFDKESLSNVSYDELRRIIREDEPPRPSARISTLAEDTRSTVASRQQIAPQQLSRQLKGELDWVVMRALEKDRERRYESPGALAADVQRYLSDEPVTARPPSAMYRLQKLVRRKKATVAVTAGTVLFVLTLAGGAGWFVRDRADRASRLGVLADARLIDAIRLEREQRWPEALAAAERAAEVVATGDADHRTQARVQQTLAVLRLVQRLDEARQLESQVTGGTFDRAGAEQAYSRAFTDFGLYIEGVAVERAAEQLGSRPDVVVALASALTDWARLQRFVCECENRVDADWRHLLAVADAIDPDPWRRSLRAAWKAPLTESEALRGLAGSADVATLSPSSVVLLGRLLRERVSPDEAAKLLRQARQYRPDDFWINFDLAGCLADSTPKRLDDAISYYQAALALRPGNPAVLNNLGTALSDQGKHGDAIACYEAALARHPDVYLLRNNLGSALQKHGKLSAAIAEFRTAIKLAPGFAVPYSNLGSALKEQGNLEAAIAELRRAIALDPKYGNPHNLLGSVLEDQGDIEGAMAEYRRAFQLDTKHATAYTNLGHLLFQQGQLEAAIAEFHTALALDPASVEDHSNLGGALHLRGEPDAALAELRRAIELKPDHAPAHNNLGHVLQDLGRLDEAIAAYRLAIEHDPTVAEPHLNLGTALAEQRRFDEAIVEYHRAIELDPDDSAAYFNLGNALKAQGRLDEAIVEYRRAIERDEKPAAPHYNLGNVYQEQGRLDEAMAEFRTAIRIDPRLAEAHNNLGNVLKKLGRLDEAIAEFRAALDVNPRLMQALHNLGLGLHDQKKLPEAIDAYRRAIEIAPDYVQAHNSLGAALYEQGDRDGAIAALRTALEVGLRVNGPEHTSTQIARTNLAGIATNWSWTLATAANESERDLNKAVLLARLAADLLPGDANHWNNLGVAHYQRGDFQSAIDALERADALLDGGDRAHRMFFAMAHWRLERREQARELYAQGAAWIAANAESDEEQRRFRADAEALMGIDAAERVALIMQQIKSTAQRFDNEK